MYFLIDFIITTYERFEEKRFKKSVAKTRKRVRAGMATKSRYKDSISARGM